MMAISIMSIEPLSPDLAENHLMSLLITAGVFSRIINLHYVFEYFGSAVFSKKVEHWWNIGIFKSGSKSIKLKGPWLMFFVPSYTYVLCLCWIMDTDEIKRHTYIHLYTTSFIILYINYIKIYCTRTSVSINVSICPKFTSLTLCQFDPIWSSHPKPQVLPKWWTPILTRPIRRVGASYLTASLHEVVGLDIFQIDPKEQGPQGKKRNIFFFQFGGQAGKLFVCFVKLFWILRIWQQRKIGRLADSMLAWSSFPSLLQSVT